MDAINLSDYVRHWLLLRNLEDKKLFDQVIYLWWKDDLFELNIDSNTKSLLIILDVFPLKTFWSEIEALEINVCILNLDVWLSSISKKLSPEINDLSLVLKSNFSIYEPYDFVNFFYLLEKDESKKYFRLTSQYLTWKVQLEDSSTRQLDLIDLSMSWLSGSDATFLFSWSMLVQSIYIIKSLQESGIFVDLFVFSNYQFPFSDSLHASIAKTEKLFFVVDHIPEKTILESYQLAIHKMIPNVKIWFISPNYSAISSIDLDDKYMQAWFDQQELFLRIKKDLA